MLSRPAIYAANNKKAVITSGRRIPVPTSSITDLSNTSSVRTNIAYQDVVLKLEVIPLINSNKEVNLTIAQVNDTVVGQQRVGGQHRADHRHRTAGHHGDRRQSHRRSCSAG